MSCATVAFDALLDDIAAGRMPPIPERMRGLVERAAAAKPIADVDAWADRLASDLTDALLADGETVRANLRREVAPLAPADADMRRRLT